MRCERCGSEMSPLFSSFFCPNDCDRRPAPEPEGCFYVLMCKKDVGADGRVATSGRWAVHSQRDFGWLRTYVASNTFFVLRLPESPFAGRMQMSQFIDGKVVTLGGVYVLDYIVREEEL